jgi:hypothetical protein
MDKINKYREYFRDTYVPNDSGMLFLKITNGKIYLFIITLIIITIPVILFNQIKELPSYFLYLIPIYFLICNFIEYILHRYPMHHKTKNIEFLFDHVSIHHMIYNEKTPFIEKDRDIMGVFLPIFYFFFISLEIVLISGLIYLFTDLNNGLFFAFIAYSYYLMYEFLHFCYHTKEDSIIKKIPLIRKLAQFHLDHHNIKLMQKYNFNITFPIFDKIFKTEYKK